MTSPYLPVTPEDQSSMLQQIGAASVDDLFSDIPEALRRQQPLRLPGPEGEQELLSRLSGMAEQNQHNNKNIDFLGAGVYDHFIPSVIDHLAGRSEFYTAYTPYQPEISQGSLQAFYEYQSLLAELTAMDVSNASLYDGASSLAEAVLMAHSSTNRNKFLICRTVHPEYRQVVTTYTQNLDLSFIEVPFKDGVSDAGFIKEHLSQDIAAVIVQQPNFFGCLEDLAAFNREVASQGALLVLVVDPLSQGVLAPAGELGASIAVGEGQGLGVEMSFGGPGFGFLACREQFVRRMPGRLIGQTTDTQGRRGFVLTLQTREQHIRREKATSNICTNQALMALRAAIYLGCLGKQGIREVGEACLQKSHYALREIQAKTKFKPAFAAPFFKEFSLVSPVPAEKVQEQLKRRSILGGIPMDRFYPELKGHLLFSVTEKRTKAEIDLLVEALKDAAK